MILLTPIKKTNMDVQKPIISFDESELCNSEFSVGGKEEFKSEVIKYSNDLFDCAIKFSERDNVIKKEVTGNHVKKAVSLNNINATTPKYYWALRIGQYLCAGLAGLAGNYMSNCWGAISFAVFFSIGVILLSIEIYNNTQ